MMSAEAWDERYKTATLPWDSGVPAAELVDYVSPLKSPPRRVLEIGCGTGTNAIWLAQRGCEVIATDVSATAIEMAKNKAAKAGVKIQFVVQDILAETPVAPGSVDFVFDRGVYHVMDTSKRRLFARRVAEALDQGGFWLSMSGCADEVREPGVVGPPQLKARDLIDNIEPEFEVHKLERAEIADEKKFLCWIALFRKRPPQTRAQHDLEALWEAHCANEFEHKDVDATMKTMIDEPYVNHVPTMTGGLGQKALADFYDKHFISRLPADTKIIPVSRTAGANSLVDEIIFCFTHDQEVDFLLPKVPATGKYVEVPTVAIVAFEGDKIANEHIYWDQASVLVQIGLLDPTSLPVAGAETARKVLDKTRPSNELIGK